MIPRACESSIKKDLCRNMTPFYTSHWIGQPILKRSALSLTTPFFVSGMGVKKGVMRIFKVKK